MEELCEKIGYAFENPGLLDRAFRHSSYVNEQCEPGLRDNERLEFLGDAVLDLAVSHLLMEFFEDAEEGELSKYRALLVDETRLSEVARELGLGEYLLLGKGEEQSNGREKPSILADSVEALLGAVYLDGGFEKALGVIRRLFSPFVERVDKEEMVRDFKSLVQEITQQFYQVTPRYRTIHEEGPPHDKTFEVALLVHGKILGKGQGKSKKEAEQRAAREAFYCLRKGMHT